ncbi:MAG: TolC family protein [Prevotellaceae bacterium]|jgi:outer membrane protein TolC|nr:TolC family protein [Prevotellaceae bacterium]
MKTGIFAGAVILLMFCMDVSYSQTMTIEECFRKAKANYPLIKQHNLVERSKEYSISNLQKTFLPQIVANVQASYQSEVITLPVNIPNISAISKGQYRATVDLSQTLWDGGIVKSQKELTQAATNVELQNVEVEMYPIVEQVCNLYFGALLTGEQLKQLDILKENLEVSLAIANAMQKNGVAIASDIDALNVEILNTLQKKTEIRHLKNAYTQMLSSLIAEPLDSLSFVRSTNALPDLQNIEIRRPEISLFERQISLLDAREDMLKSKNMPHFSLFVQGGYGRPGLNMLSNNFDFWAIGGLRMSWYFGNFYTKSNEKRIINIDREKIRNREETLKVNINRQLLQIRNEIDSYSELMTSDKEIIALREKVRIASEKKYNNGICTVNDLIKDINAENLARQSRAIHETLYLMSIYKYKNVAGTINFE